MVANVTWGRSCLRWVLAVLGLAGLVITSACSGTEIYPVYEQRPVGVLSSDAALNYSDYRQSMAPTRLGIPPIQVPQFSDRDGQIFHNALRDRLAPTGLSQDFAYELVSRSFSVSSSDLQDQVGGAQTLARYRVSFSFRVNRIDLDGARTLVFADTYTVYSDYNAPPANSFFVTDARLLTARRQAIAKMADLVENSLRLQFARLNYDAVR